MTTLFDELHDIVQRVADGVGPSVVRIGRGPGRGAGIVVADGLVLTNAHNLRGPETTVTFADGHSHPGTAQAVDPDGDLTVLSVDTGGAPAIAWEPDHAEVDAGTAVLALARTPSGALRVTAGLVSSASEAFRGPRGRRIDRSLEHTAPLGRGSSGGPVVDVTGALVGVNTHRIGDGFYLALPADAELRTRVDALGRGEAPVRPTLGVAIAPPHAARQLRAAVGLPERDGLLVRAVQDDSPAAAAGVRQGDLLVAAGGSALTDPDALHRALAGLQPGATLTLTVVRGVDELEIVVAFDGPAAPTQA